MRLDQCTEPHGFLKNFHAKLLEEMLAVACRSYLTHHSTVVGWNQPNLVTLLLPRLGGFANFGLIVSRSWRECDGARNRVDDDSMMYQVSWDFHSPVGLFQGEYVSMFMDWLFQVTWLRFATTEAPTTKKLGIDSIEWELAVAHNVGTVG